jgi:hypothetical protein
MDEEGTYRLLTDEELRINNLMPTGEENMAVAKEVVLPIRAEVNLEIKGVIEGLVVKPGDTLLLSMQRRISDQECHEITTRIHDLIPGVFVIVMPQIDHIAIIPTDYQKIQDTVSKVMEREFRTIARKNGLLPR